MLKQFTKGSMMRLSILIVMLSFIFLNIILGVYILKADEIDWLGISAFYGAVAVNIFGVLFNKAQQKKHETSGPVTTVN